MKKKQRFKVNQKIQITALENERYYNTTIQDLSENVIYVAIPSIRGRELKVPQGEQVKGRFIEADAIFDFVTTVLGFKYEDRIPLLMLQKPIRITRNQRRSYFRLSRILDLNFSRVQSDEEKEAGVAKEWIETKTIDISGGGLRFLTPVRLTEGEIIEIMIYFGPKDEGHNMIHVKGEVIRGYPVASTAKSFTYSLRFTDIHETERDRIINYIFNLTSKGMH